SGERKFNNEVIDKPLDYINEAPVVGPGYDIVPERFWYEETQLNWDHCKEWEKKFNNEVIDKQLDYINEAPVVGPGYDIVPERFWYEETQLNWDHCKESFELMKKRIPEMTSTDLREFQIHNETFCSRLRDAVYVNDGDSENATAFDWFMHVFVVFLKV
ncbi:hypothetical protein QYM36_018653, partial [Artemia franciscana]